MILKTLLLRSSLTFAINSPMGGDGRIIVVFVDRTFPAELTVKYIRFMMLSQKINGNIFIHLL